jgi:hypothetical protein
VMRAAVWSGSAGSWTPLEPAGATAWTTDAGQHGGWVHVGNIAHASLWAGAGWIDLHPPGASESQVRGISGGQQVGFILSGSFRASLWMGSAASWVDLRPVGAGDSFAYGVAEGQQVGMALIAGADHASLWTGTAASWVDLNPPGAQRSIAYGAAAGRQVGLVLMNGQEHAALWTGAAGTWVNLDPIGAVGGIAYGAHGGMQAGVARFATGGRRASVWSGTASSWEDLSTALTGSWRYSEARAIWSDGTTLYVAGHAFNEDLDREEAMLWTRPMAQGCYANCDASTVSPVLNVGDFTCFLQRFAAGESYANCDESTVPPVLNVGDFTCFLQRFAAGCP